MKRFLFLSYGFEQPTPDTMGAWQRWFASIADRTVDQGGIRLNGEKIADGTTAVTLVDERFVLIQKGKKQRHLAVLGA